MFQTFKSHYQRCRRYLDEFESLKHKKHIKTFFKDFTNSEIDFWKPSPYSPPCMPQLKTTVYGKRIPTRFGQNCVFKKLINLIIRF